MCGISGIFDPNNTLLSNEKVNLINKMNHAIIHRGPNSQNYWLDDLVTLGSTRLSILDLSERGSMPMSYKQNTIVHNGEVYNYKEIKNKFSLDKFKTDTDTEVILKSFNKIGKNCLNHFNGMFSFVIWDKTKKELFAARDRIGIKPFFYTWHEGRFYFASEIKALLAAGIPAIPNYKIIRDYLVNGVYDHSNETFFKNINQLPAGHFLLLDKNSIKIEEYWNLNSDLEEISFDKYNSINGYDKAKNEFLDLFQDSLNLRLRSDVPVAVNISGGVDSTALVSMIDHIQKGQGQLKAFSYYYGEEKYDEIKEVQETTSKYKWGIDYFKISSKSVPELAEEVMLSQEQPFPGMPTLAKHSIIKHSKSFDSIVLLEGQGGDEIAAGYQYVFASHILDLIEANKTDLANDEIKAFAEINNFSTKEAEKIVKNGIASMNQTGRSADGTRSTDINCLDKNFVDEYNNQIQFEKPFKSNLLNMQYRDIKYTKLPRILRSCDRSSMSSSKELRVPLLDHRLVELSFSLPGEFKIKNGIQRFFMRDALKKIGNSRLIDQPKRTVVDPQREWLKNELRPWVLEILNSESFRSRSIFNIAEITTEYENYCKRDINLNSFKIWQWISIELWFRKFIDNKLVN